jgi:hypothetical protein
MSILVLSRRTRTALASAGFLAAGFLTGCQGGPQIMRGDGTNNVQPITTPMVNSPAFAQVAAGQNLPTGNTQLMANRMPNQPLVAGQPVLGSGGAVYPVNGSAPQPNMVAGPQNPIVMQPAPIVQAPPQAQGMGQIVGVMQTPNGPQYVYAETPAPVPTSPIVTNTPPVTIAPPPIIATEQPALTAPPSYNVPTGPPTFVAPPPTTITVPVLNTAAPTTPPSFAPSETSYRAPELLPSTVTMRPAGVTLPSNTPANPPLGSFPGAPVSPKAPVLQTGVKLPAIGRPVDDDIPDAPSFIPGGR